MRREYNIDNQEEWQLLVDAPLSQDILDYSGNGNDLTLKSGNVDYVTINGEKWMNARYASLFFDKINQSSYIDNFKMEIEIYALSSMTRYFAIVEGFALVGNTAIKIGSNWGTLLSIGIQKPNTSQHDDAIYGLPFEISNLPRTIPIKIELSNFENTLYAAVFDMSGENPVLIKEKSEITPTFGTACNEYLRFGSSTYSSSQRYFNGYIRNFKLYKHI